MIGPDKIYLLQARLAPILREHGLADLDALADRLRGGPARSGSSIEAGIDAAIPTPTSALHRDVIEAMTTNESFFFRDDKPFDHVRTQALPRLHAARPRGARLRIWSAASSSGQEAYSLAMIVAECRAALADREVDDPRHRHFARAASARARDGLYTQFEVQRGLPMQMLVKYFRKEGTRIGGSPSHTRNGTVPRMEPARRSAPAWHNSTSCSAAMC